jgi:hypothetical protein
MGKLFLGKWWHWLMLVIAIVLFWQAGAQKIHVIHFNTFVLVLLAGTVAIVLLLVKGTRRGEQITREVLQESEPGPASEVPDKE